MKPSSRLKIDTAIPRRRKAPLRVEPCTARSRRASSSAEIPSRKADLAADVMSSVGDRKEGIHQGFDPESQPSGSIGALSHCFFVGFIAEQFVGSRRNSACTLNENRQHR